MSDPAIPLVIGYITRYSNEVNMLKSIMRFARMAGDSGGHWLLVYLNDVDADGQAMAKDKAGPVSGAPDLASLPGMCQSLGGDFTVVDVNAKPDFMAFHLFAVTVKNYRVAKVLVDNAMTKMPFKDTFQAQIDKALPETVERINIENKQDFLGRKSFVGTRLLHRFHRFAMQSFADIMIGLLFGLFAVVMTYGVHYALNHHVAPVDDSYTFMIFVLFANICALQAGIWGGVACTIVTSLAANYFFIAPYYAFKLTSVSDAVNWLVLVITSSVTSIISALMVIQYRKSRQEEKNLSVLLDINTTPLKHKTITVLLRDLKKRLREHLRTDVVFFVPSLMNDQKLEVFHDTESDMIADLPDNDAIQTIWLDMQHGYVYAYQQHDDTGPWVFLPLSTLHSDIGILALRRVSASATQSMIDYKKLSDMIAVILEYVNLDQEMHARDIMKEKDKLRTHILSSVSHDLKTPLASIIGSLGLYLSAGTKLKDTQIKLLIDNAYSEANRLDGFITNILTMTKLEAGSIKFRKEQIRPQQLLAGAIDKIRWKLPEDRLQIVDADNREFVTVDVNATELVITNLLDNAVRHSTDGTPIVLRFHHAPQGGYSLSVANDGDTIPSDELETIFDKYARLQREDSQKAATGLGLALCRGLMQGQGGDIAVQNTDHGVVFTVTWPDV